MGLTSYQASVLALASTINYWPFNGSLVDTKGSVNLTATNTPSYVAGRDGNQAALFDGVNDCAFSSASIDLTGTNKVSIMFWCYLNVYDLANDEVLAEFSTDTLLVATGFNIASAGTQTDDPLSLQINGDVGRSRPWYNNSTFGWSTPTWHHICCVYDKSLATNEVNLYINGVLATASSRTFNSNNTNNFGNHVLYIGGRANSTLFSNHTVCDFSLHNDALSAGAILGAYQSSQLGLNTRQNGSLKLRNRHKLRVA